MWTVVVQDATEEGYQEKRPIWKSCDENEDEDDDDDDVMPPAEAILQIQKQRFIHAFPWELSIFCFPASTRFVKVGS